ncbi:hypothetical protein K438DRAFT_1752634 [Mycena galopus ATCC 62051]|nr:hypothetical protein K438DRAFT_1752634 [Mycena galopus ATCC 62051]
MPPETKGKLEKALTILNGALVTFKPALDLTAAGVTGLGIPGVEGAMNAVVRVAEMVLTMKANREDLSELGERVKKLVEIGASTILIDSAPELTERLTVLTSKLCPLAEQCHTLGGKHGLEWLWFSKQHQEAIQGIKDSIASEIQAFTFHSNISVEELVRAMVSRGEHISSI